MNDIKFKYDVAFSFLQKDEKLALQLSDLLSGRFKTFVYSENQAELAGKNGEQIFNDVFGEQSRIVVVLFRSDWGQTKWTRIEMTAIRNRAFEYGYDFTLFIPLEDNLTLPKWLPKTQIWFNYNRWGAEGATSIIEFKIQQEGGTEHKETVKDKAARLERAFDAQKKKEAFLNSVEGVNAANSEIQKLFDEIENLLKIIHEDKNYLRINFDRDHGGRAISILFGIYNLHLEWYGMIVNTLQDHYLSFSLWQRPSFLRGESDEKKLYEYKIKFDVSTLGNYGWTTPNENHFCSSFEFAEYTVNTVLEKIESNQ